MAEADVVREKRALPSSGGAFGWRSAAALLKRLNDFLASLSMTLVAAAFLLLDLVPHVMEEFGQETACLQVLPFDPAWVTVAICGVPLLYLSVRRIICNRGISKISSALLISMAMLAAIAIGDLFAAGEVAFIMALGALLEEAITERAKKGLKNLLSLSPTQGRRIKGGAEEMVAIEEIVRGDVLRILPGERIPVDGRIVSGETSIDQSVMTGESLPVDKKVGEEVFCGTLNCFGSRLKLPAEAHPHGAGGRGEAGADAAHRRPLGELARAHRARPRRRRLCCDGEHHHRRHLDGRLLPVRARLGDAHGDHGSDRAGDEARRHHQIRRDAGKDGQGGHGRF